MEVDTSTDQLGKERGMVDHKQRMGEIKLVTGPLPPSLQAMVGRKRLQSTSSCKSYSAKAIFIALFVSNFVSPLPLYFILSLQIMKSLNIIVDLVTIHSIIK